MGGETYPIIGRIDLKTTQGFRKNDTFTNLFSRFSFTIDGVANT